ncbi:MAG: response regulator [Flavobacteriaceae bacterium]
MIDVTPSFTCTAAFPNCNNLIEKLEKIDCDICLMDIEMPGISGIEATKLIKAHFPKYMYLSKRFFPMMIPF